MNRVLAATVAFMSKATGNPRSLAITDVMVKLKECAAETAKTKESVAMPPRLVTAVLILAWLATSSWLFYQDLWPRIRPGEPPAFRIDFSDEVLAKRPPVHWTVYKNG